MSKPILKIKKEKNLVRLEADGDLTIQHSSVLKKFLQQSLDRSSEETFTLKSITALDLTCIQLLYSWRQALHQQGRKATIELPEHKNIQALIEKTGITKILQYV